MSDDKPRRWRTGRSVGRTIYVQTGDEPSKEDELVGVMDTPQLAALVVTAVNAWLTATTGDLDADDDLREPTPERTPPDDTTDLRDRLLAADLVSHMITASDGYPSVVVHSREEAAERALAVVALELERLRADLAEAREDAKEQRRFHDALREEVRGWSPIKLMAQIEELQAELAEMTACRDAAVRASDRAEAAIERVRGKAKAMRNRATGVAAGGAYERGALLTLKAAAGDILAALDTPTDRDESGDA